MRNLDMSLVFKLNSVEDLGLLHAALKQVKTLQEMVKLERDVKTLTRQKKLLENELKEIKSEIHTLCPERGLIKSNISDEMDKEDPSVEEEETMQEDRTENSATVELERPAEAVRVNHVEETSQSPLIEERTDGDASQEDETIV